LTDPGGQPPELSQTRRRRWSDLGPRLGSAAVLIAVTVGALYLGGYVFAAAVSIVFALAYREWETMVSRAPLTPAGMVLIALVAVSGVAFPLFGVAGTLGAIALACVIALVIRGEGMWWRVLGLCIYGVIIVSALILRGNSEAGILASIYLGTVVWMTDSAAFFAGRQIGGEKLAPEISPSKTWSGALGGLALGTGAGLIVWLVVTDSPWWIGLLIAASISVLGQAGDLAESAIKRHFRI